MSINLQDVLRLLLTTCNFTVHFYYGLTPEASITDIELLIYWLLIVKFI